MRIQIELNDSGVNLLKRIKKAAESEDMSHRELFDNALTVLDWCVQQRQQGRIVASLDESEKNYKELIMPILQKVEVLVKKAVAHGASYTVARAGN